MGRSQKKTIKEILAKTRVIFGDLLDFMSQLCPLRVTERELPLSRLTALSRQMSKKLLQICSKN